MAGGQSPVGPKILRMRQRAGWLTPPGDTFTTKTFTYAGQIDCFSGISASYCKGKVPVVQVDVQSTVVAAYCKGKAPAVGVAAQSSFAPAISKTKDPDNNVIPAQSTIAGTTVFAPFTASTFTYSGLIAAHSTVIADTELIDVGKPLDAGPAPLHFARPGLNFPFNPPRIIYVFEYHGYTRARAGIESETSFTPSNQYETQGVVAAPKTRVSSASTFRPVSIFEWKGGVRAGARVASARARTWEAQTGVTIAGGQPCAKAHFEDWLEKVRRMDDELLMEVA